MSDVGVIVSEWKQLGVDSNYFIGHPSIPLKISDYRTAGVNSKSTDFKQPNPVLFKAGYTTYGIVLQAPRNGNNVNAAVIGFNSNNGTIDCLEIQGGKDRYRELTPVHWDGFLLKSLIRLGRKADLDTLLLMPTFMMDISDAATAERLKRRYDDNAERHGFRLSQSEKRFVLELQNS